MISPSSSASALLPSTPSPHEQQSDRKSESKLKRGPAKEAGHSESATTGISPDLLSSHTFSENPQEKYERNLQITSFALAMFALLLMSFGFGAWGLATTKDVMMSGFGFMYQFVGTHFVMLSLGTFVSSLVVLMAAHCRCGKGS